MRTPQGSHYYLTDNVGSAVALTGPGPDADITATYRYEPFGQTQDTTGDLIQPYRFAGQYLDSRTGHYKIGLRYYDPQLARWTQQDALTGYMDPRRANPYIYANQDPIDQTDPSGAKPVGPAAEAFNALEELVVGPAVEEAGRVGAACTIGVTGGEVARGVGNIVRTPFTRFNPYAAGASCTVGVGTYATGFGP